MQHHVFIDPHLAARFSSCLSALRRSRSASLAARALSRSARFVARSASRAAARCSLSLTLAAERGLSAAASGAGLVDGVSAAGAVAAAAGMGAPGTESDGAAAVVAMGNYFLHNRFACSTAYMG